MNFCNGNGGFSGGADNAATIGNMFQHYGNSADHVLMSGRDSIGGADVCSSNGNVLDTANSSNQSYGVFGSENAADVFGFTPNSNANANAYNEKPGHDDGSAFTSVSHSFMANSMSSYNDTKAKSITTTTTAATTTSCSEINPTKILSNYCDAAMMMAAAAVNAQQQQQQQQQQQRRMFAGGNNDNSSNADSCGLDIGRNAISSIVSSSSLPSTTSSISSALSSASSTLSNAASTTTAGTLNLLTPSANRFKAQQHQQQQLYDRKLHQQHDQEQEAAAHRLSASPNLIDINEVPLIVDVK